MVCIHCGYKKTQVTNSRPHKSTASVWRRRHCPNCRHTVTSYEMVASQHLPLVTYAQQPPQRLNTFRLALSFTQVLTTDNEPAAYELSMTVAQKILADGLQEVSRDDVVKYSYQTLVSFDRTAGTQYGVRYGVVRV